MPAHSEIVADADLFTALHNAIHELQDRPAVNDRRGGERRAFACTQLLAPYDGLTLPAQEEYALALCHDLSPTGFSYLCDAPPQFDRLIVALGRTPFRFFIAEVVSRRPLKRGGRPKLLIGCRFMSRVE